jgi:nicotinamidase/pyrazinamidase
VTEKRDARAIIVVDPQPDFFEGGALPVAGATDTVARIARYLRDHADEFSMKVVTQDWHVDPGDHWSDAPNFVTSWPVHCVADSNGAALDTSLADHHWDAVIRKGRHEGAYSGFDGVDESGASLAAVLASAGIEDVSVVGFATDHCVMATALDALELGFDVKVLLDLCAGVDHGTTMAAVATMANAGVSIAASSDV